MCAQQVFSRSMRNIKVWATSMYGQGNALTFRGDSPAKKNHHANKPNAGSASFRRVQGCTAVLFKNLRVLHWLIHGLYMGYMEP